MAFFFCESLSLFTFVVLAKKVKLVCTWNTPTFNLLQGSKKDFNPIGISGQQIVLGRSGFFFFGSSGLIVGNVGEPSSESEHGGLGVCFFSSCFLLFEALLGVLFMGEQLSLSGRNPL